ncbi:MAG TPA: glycoside hydrolase family 88 protein [Anaerolineae bacterium]|nr:glycoside hydrolase family 88 protein [Anaerolineae bacterium]
MNSSLSVVRVRAILDGWSQRNVVQIIVELGDDFPDYFDPQVDAWARNGGWTEGFWPGILWQLYAHSKDRKLLGWARYYTRLLTERKSHFTDHDLGFLYDHSAVLEHALTGDNEVVPEALAAAGRLADRFNPAGCFIRAHGALDDPERAGYAIIDTAMNLHLLFWAHALTGEERFYRVAHETASTIAREYVRSDGSTYQVVWFNPATGAVEQKGTLQGCCPESSWSRGQAWAIYGFAQIYRATGEASYRDEAWAVARYFLHHVPEDGVVPYDFLDPDVPAAPKDTSAQAIAAAGLLALADLSTGQERRFLLAGAERLLAPLCDGYLAPPHPVPGRSRGLLRGGCYFLARGRGVDSELMFGDYYLVEALVRYLAFQAWA